MTASQGKYRFAYSKRAVSIVVLFVAATCILALATSTKPDEYQVMSGFMTREETTTTLQALLPSNAAAVFAIHDSVHRSKPLVSLGTSNETAAKASDAPLTVDEIEDNVQDWIGKNPHEAQKIVFAIYLGLVLLCVGLVCLIWSEVTTIFVVRELDANLESGLPMYQDLEDKAGKWARGMRSTQRPWWSLGGLAAILVGTLVMRLPLCNVIADWGLPEAVAEPGDCYTVVVLDAVLQAVMLAALATGACWSCVRPNAALLLFSIAVGALCALALHDPVFTLCWALLSGALAAYYLSAATEAQSYGEKAPLKGNMV